MRQAYPSLDDVKPLVSGLSVIAKALNDGDLARAMVGAIQLKLEALDWNRAVRIAYANTALAKYDPDEPRDWRGRWTDEDENDSHVSGMNSLTEIAYPGTYHDKVVAKLAEIAKSHGSYVLTAVNLIAVNGATARADLIIMPPTGKPLILIEVKTGKDPTYTDGQMIVYPLAELGDHVSSPDQKIAQFGFLPGDPLPPMHFEVLYSEKEGSPLVYFPNGFKMIHKIYVNTNL